MPEPSEVEKQHSQQLVDHIRLAIEQAGGEISFQQYMQMALYEPGLGYYAAGAQKFGESGDFITAPEVSPLFAQSIARQVQQVFQQLDQPVLVEFGAGSGIFCADLLAELNVLDSLPEKYLVIELSAELQQRQMQTLQQQVPELVDRVQWLQQLPEKLNAVVIANEVLDAMPVHCFQKNKVGTDERCVSVIDGQLSWSRRTGSDELQNAVVHIEQEMGAAVAEGYCSEVNLSIQPWLNSVSSMLQNGLVLLIDYGYPRAEYYLPERTQGSLICFYKHRAHDDVFYYPGIQDITAFVDFTAVAEAALGAGFDVMGFTTQVNFLFGCGLPQIVESKMAALNDSDVKQQLHISQQVKTLTLPSEMGERFKVMALGKGLEPGLSGFTMQDMRNRL